MHFISDRDIFYQGKEQNIIVVEKGKSIPFFSAVNTWEEMQYKDGKAKVVFDLRRAGIYGADFDNLKLNDGGMYFGDEFLFKVTPRYKYFKNK